MAWVNKGKKRYYYRSRRVGARVVRDYFGTGAIAEMAAHLMGALREVWQRQARGAERLDGAAESYRRFHDLLDRAAAAHLLASGYYRHDRGPWRKRRDS